MTLKDLSSTELSQLRLGVDLSRAKIVLAVIGGNGRMLEEWQIPNPGDYHGLLVALRNLCDNVVDRQVRLGICIPGSISPTTGLIRNSNCTYLNGKDFAADLAEATGRQVRLANDANCFSLSEAIDGAAATYATVFGVIIDTGVGGGLVVDRTLLAGAGGIAGEWGHIPLPWASADEHQATACWCGQRNCMELWVSGPSFEADYRYGQPGLSATQIVGLARSGERAAINALGRYISRLARGLAVICNLFDPHAIVLGGDMSNLDELYEALPGAIAPYLFTDRPANRILRNLHGGASAVRGAAWLWPRVDVDPVPIAREAGSDRTS